MKKRILLFVFASSIVTAVQIPSLHPAHLNIEAPWFTGPLLAPSALTIPGGHYNIEPYVYAIAQVGIYDNDWQAQKEETVWTNYTQESLQFGINSWADFAFFPTLYYNHTNGAGMWELGDLPIKFDFQLHKNIRSLDQWSWALSFSIEETIPLGKFRNLSPKKKKTDVGGAGSWQTTFVLNWGNLFRLRKNYFITWRTALEYTIPAPVHVKNLNFYGGGRGTNGIVYPGKTFLIDSAVEINLSQNWAFALDVVGQWATRVRFKGKTLISNTVPKSIQFSLAPAIEYNWSANIGIIFGSWFTIAGKNAKEFVGGVAAFNYYH